MYRRYHITVNVKNSGAGFTEEILPVFGCSITEPSNWVEYGQTEERGLTFLDEDGKELNSVVFEHQPYFSSGHNKTVPEKEEIKQLVCSALFRHYHLNAEEVIVSVTEV